MREHIKKIKQMDVGKVVEDVSLKEHTTYKVGGIAKCFVYPKDVKSLIKVLKYIKNNNIKFKVLGNGSNTLFSDIRLVFNCYGLRLYLVTIPMMELSLN